VQDEWGERNMYKVLVGKPEGKRPDGRPRRMWEKNIEIAVRGVGWGSADLTNLAQGMGHWWALAKTAINLQVP
jgi:hypothetical protein